MTIPTWPAAHHEALRQFYKIERLAIATLDAIDPRVTLAVRFAVATNLAHAEELVALRGELGAAPTDLTADVAVRFAEQFVVDVSGVDEALLGAIGSAFGASTFCVVQSIYVIDIFQRARMAFDRLFDGQPASDAASLDDGDLWAEIESFMRGVAVLDAVDPVVTELVRLCGARVHQCRICQSRLSAAAVDAAGTEALFGTEGGSGIDARQRAAVELAEALVTQPSLLNADLVAKMHKEFSATELLEIVLDVARNAANKIAVAFGADAAAVSEGVEYFAIDAAGELVANVDINVLR